MLPTSADFTTKPVGKGTGLGVSRPRLGDQIFWSRTTHGCAAWCKAFWRGAGYRVLVASNGGAAWPLADTHAGPIDLLVSDVVMPHRTRALRLTRWR